MGAVKIKYNFFICCMGVLALRIKHHNQSKINGHSDSLLNSNLKGRGKIWAEWYGLVAKGPGSHPRGAGSIPGTEPNWPGQCLTRMLDYLFLSIFLLFSSSMASWKPHLHQGNNCQCWTNALWNVVIILPCLFAPQIWVESLLLFSSI